VLVDCGPGTAGRIALHVPPQQLDAVVISHLHPDHFFDLVQLYYLLRFGPPRAARLPLLVPPAATTFLADFGELISTRRTMLDDIFDVLEYDPARPVELGSLRIQAYAVQHYIPSHAQRIRAADGATLVFSSDVGPCPQLLEAAAGADLFLCEAALLDPAQDEPVASFRGHLCAAEAGEAARDAGVRRLLLTHYRSTPETDARHLSAARRAFDGPVDLAREGETYAVR
jgi:ribonuclease BN (tRNA processing enzyme)